MSNEAAERLRHRIFLFIDGDDEWQADGLLLDEALAAERKATVERLRSRLQEIEAALPGVHFGGVYGILDEEAAR